MSPSCNLSLPAATSGHDVRLAGFHARVVGPTGILAELLALIPGLPLWPLPDRPSGDPATVFEVAAETDATASYRIAQDGHLRWAGLQRGEIVPLLEWALTGAAVDRLGETYALFHAGAVARRGCGLLLPGVSGSGKSTLTAALVAEGFQLFSDEIGMLDPVSGRLVPFPKRPCVKEGGRAVLAARYFPWLADAPGYRRGDELAWYIDPSPEAWAVEPVPIRYVVFPRYLPDSRTRIAPIGRSAALPMLLEHLFSGGRLGPAGVERAVAVLRDAECFTLAVGELAAAVALLQGLYDRPAAR